jgi:hypothetical protein
MNANYTIEIIGSGLEIVVGKIQPKIFEYFSANKINIKDYINETIEIPKEFIPFENNSWFECDDICHLHNAYLAKTSKIIFKKDLEIINEFNLSWDDLEKNKINFENTKEIYISEMPQKSFIFLGKSFEKGSFFLSKFKSKKLDLKKLRIEYFDIEGEEIISEIFYDNKKLSNEDSFTNGQSLEFDIFKS